LPEACDVILIEMKLMFCSVHTHDVHLCTPVLG